MDDRLRPVSCDCDQCASMCAHSTCLPTPEEARELIRKGYGGRLATYRWVSDPDRLRFVGPAPKGMEGARDLTSTREGACTFFDGKHCELHNTGLKPLEGRLAHHTRPWQVVRLHIHDHWKGKSFQSVESKLNKFASEISVITPVTPDLL